MKVPFEVAKYTVQGVAALAAGLWGELPLMIQVLIGLMAADIVAGLLAAYIAQKVSSRVSFRGMARKGLILIVVGMSALLEPVIGVAVATAVAGFFVVHESISILENATLAGLPIPHVLKDALTRVPGSGDKQSGRLHE